METMFLGKPFTYWVEIDTSIKKYIIDEKLFTENDVLAIMGPAILKG